MRFAAYQFSTTESLAITEDDGFHGALRIGPAYPGTQGALVAAGPERLHGAGRILLSAPVVALDAVGLLPPCRRRPRSCASA